MGVIRIAYTTFIWACMVGARKEAEGRSARAKPEPEL